MDIALVDGVAAARPDWQIVMIGPVVKIDPASLPQRPNIHYLGLEALRRAAALRRRLGRRAAAVRAQRGDAVHQSDQDAGVHGGRQARRLDVDSRRRAPLWRAGAGADRRRRRPRSSQRALRRWPRTRRQRVTQADAFLRQTSWDGTWTRIRSCCIDARAGAPQVARPRRDVRLTAPADRASTPFRSLDYHGAGVRMFDYLVVGAGFAGATIAERLAAHADKKGADLRQAARTSAATPTITTTRPASSSTSTVRTSFTPTRARSTTICRGSRRGGRTSIACWPASTASCCRFRSTSTR